MAKKTQLSHFIVKLLKELKERGAFDNRTLEKCDVPKVCELIKVHNQEALLNQALDRSLIR